MEVSSVCRICLCTEPSKDISDLKSHQSDEKTCLDIVSFCLSIQIEIDSKITTKLCLKCLKKITSFYIFKLAARKNDAYLKNLEYSSSNIKSENFVDEDLINEESKNVAENDFSEIPLSPEVKSELIKYDEEYPEFHESDDEFLSEIKKINYEFIPEANETKENEKKEVTAKEGKRVKKVKQCPECGKSIKCMSDHMAKHKRRKDPSLMLPCPLCGQKFLCSRTLGRHKRMTHAAQKKPCPICNKMVKFLKEHHLRVHNTDRQNNVCDVCGKCFPNQDQLEKHATVHSAKRKRIRKIAPSAKTYECDVCKKQFQQIHTVKYHKLYVHDKVKDYLCQFCSKRFGTQKHLKAHEVTHTNERPFQCAKCDKAFKLKWTLEAHMNVHSTEKNFTCTICGKAFKHPRQRRKRHLLKMEAYHQKKTPH